MTTNLLSTASPDIYAQLDLVKNAAENIQVDDLTPGFSKKVWWQCNHGHSWEAVVYSRKDAGRHRG